MFADDVRFRRKAQRFQDIRANLCVMEINAHFLMQNAFAIIGARICILGEHGRKKNSNGFPYGSKVALFSPNIMQKCATCQKRRINRFLDFRHEPLRASSGTKCVALVGNRHRKKQVLKYRHEHFFDKFPVFHGNVG